MKKDETLEFSDYRARKVCGQLEISSLGKWIIARGTRRSRWTASELHRECRTKREKHLH
jgi:hypothetical protein